LLQLLALAPALRVDLRELPFYRRQVGVLAVLSALVSTAGDRFRFLLSPAAYRSLVATGLLDDLRRADLSYRSDLRHRRRVIIQLRLRRGPVRAHSGMGTQWRDIAGLQSASDIQSCLPAATLTGSTVLSEIMTVI
jgi:hypothetical protein